MSATNSSEGDVGRRDFLKLFGAAGAAASTIPISGAALAEESAAAHKAYRQNYLSLDPTYTDVFGRPLGEKLGAGSNRSGRGGCDGRAPVDQEQPSLGRTRADPEKFLVLRWTGTELLRNRE